MTQRIQAMMVAEVVANRRAARGAQSSAQTSKGTPRGESGYVGGEILADERKAAGLTYEQIALFMRGQDPYAVETTKDVGRAQAAAFRSAIQSAVLARVDGQSAERTDEVSGRYLRAMRGASGVDTEKFCQRSGLTREEVAAIEATTLHPIRGVLNVYLYYMALMAAEAGDIPAATWADTAQAVVRQQSEIRRLRALVLEMGGEPTPGGQREKTELQRLRAEAAGLRAELKKYRKP